MILSPDEFRLLWTVIESAEWQYKADGSFRVECEACGAQFADTVKNRRHRKGCEWVLAKRTLFASSIRTV